MGWKITEDLLHVGKHANYSRVGRTSRVYHGGTSEYRMLDDDRYVYFVFVADSDESAEALFDQWAMDFGMTILQYRNDHGEWKDMIS
jgi:hypothetical protein